MISRIQILLARSMLGLHQNEVSQIVGISAPALSNIESGKTAKPDPNIIKDLQFFFESKGVVFLERDGIQRKADFEFTTLHNRHGFRSFIDKVYDYAKTNSGKISIINGSTEEFIKWLGEDWYTKHAERMAGVKANIDFRIITSQQSREIASAFATYNTIPNRKFGLHTIYIFGENIGFLIFSDDELKIYVTKHKEIADTLQYMFDLTWDKTK